MDKPIPSDSTAQEPEAAHPENSIPTEGLPSRSPNYTQNEAHPEDDAACDIANEDSNLKLIGAIELLPEDQAQKEEERAAAKIKQKLRPLSKLSSARRNVNDTTHSKHATPPEEASRASESVEVLTSEDEEGSTKGCSVDGVRTSLSIMSGENSSSLRSAVGSVVESMAKVRVKSKKAKKESMLIEVETPRLIDAQTDVGDRRYFQCPGDPEPEGDFVYDFLYQHQRGAFFLGTPNFSSKSLLPVDPDEWTDQSFESSAMDTSDYGLPDPSWEWVHKSWLVDMTGDVDEDGWEYAMTFHGSPWHGNYEIFRSFARRRRWLRLRKRKGKTFGKARALPERTYPSSVHAATWAKVGASPLDLEDPSPFPSIDQDPVGDKVNANTAGSGGLAAPPARSNPVDLYKILKKARSDREKLAYTAQYVVRYPGQLGDLGERLDKYLGLLDYESSRREFLSLLAVYGPAEKAAVVKAAKRLEFYSDQKKLQSEAGLLSTTEA
ncbi:hypothetical protein BGZ75_003601 [Mortierella antarctica]|nr:hypothetical protein BGZ75_003601 [Mortierella antarctica]